MEEKQNKFSIILSGLLALAIVLFSILSVTAVGYNHMQLQEPEQSEDAALNAIFDKQRDASEAGENIDEFPALRSPQDGQTAQRATPDYYAGSYIEWQTAKLAVNAHRQILPGKSGKTLTGKRQENSAVRFESASVFS